MRKRALLYWVKGHPKLLVIAALLVGNLFLFSVVCGRERGVLTVAFLDVGQGDAVFIEAPNGNQLLYDAGPPSGAALRELSRVMPFWDRSIDVAVLSHPDLDHVGGFPEIFKRYDIDLVLTSGAVSDNGVHAATEVAIANEGAAAISARKGLRVLLGAGAYADIFYPDRDMSRMETNSASIVMRVAYGDTSFLFTGDLPKNIEEYVAQQEGAALSANVLKLGHHGSRTSTSPFFLSAVSPSWAVVSAGENNQYGHPHQEVLALLRAHAIPMLSTASAGTVVFQSDGESVLPQ